MEKINIAEILKDCPNGMELYSPIFGNVYLEKIRPYLAVVVSTSNKQKKEFLYDGRFGINGECMLFPSKENRDWSTFQRPFKDGDIIYVESKKYGGVGFISIYKNESSSLFYDHCSVSLDTGTFYSGNAQGLIHKNDISISHLATEEEKEKLFKAINDNGYKWNPETKTLEKLIKPKFKVGDRIKSIISQLVYPIKEVRENAYLVEEKTGYFFIPFCLERNYELVPNKFDINTLKPFDKVLVRCGNNAWHIQFFEKYDKRLNYPFVCMSNGSYNQCVPYKDNEYLLNTTDACSDFYKNWE